MFALYKQEISFTYRNVGATTSSKRRVQPYHVGEIDGGWYVIGYDVGRAYALLPYSGSRA